MSDEVDWNSVWDQSIVGSEPPPELRGVNPEDVKSIIYLTDGAPEGLSNSLSQFSGSHKLGLFAASTPFVTGRSVTLFLNDEICDSGAVGLALKQEASCGLRFHGMEPLAEPMIVSQSEGNLVILLDNKTPTQLLLSAIKQKGINLQTPDYEEFCLASIHDHEPKQMFSILSGDPSRGTIALQSNSSPPSGSRVQFFYRPKTTTAEVAATLSRGTFSFTTVPEALLGHNAEEEVADLELPDSFLAGSEKGFLVSRGKETPWTCSIPGSSAVLHWST
ncbi:FIST domain-containing protein [Mycena indigotica]|uniref:FIST domain-containing protein n=1 Tax=Mycena indigotica TaxID=2126181 RepID=A0A8H6W143_9AGAR|nr:FIST domain-containing protein [Mycena indigotica]KAF7299161.1 FIST domain-containing protein [Mycena indigotica]